MAEFKPNWYSPPGDTIAYIMEEKSMSIQSLSIQTGIIESTIVQLLDGSAVLSRDIAERLSKVLGSTTQFWINREKIYREDRKRIESGS